MPFLLSLRSQRRHEPLASAVGACVMAFALLLSSPVVSLAAELHIQASSSRLRPDVDARDKDC